MCETHRHVGSGAREATLPRFPEREGPKALPPAELSREDAGSGDELDFLGDEMEERGLDLGEEDDGDGDGDVVIEVTAEHIGRAAGSLLALPLVDHRREEIDERAGTPKVEGKLAGNAPHEATVPAPKPQRTSETKTPSPKTLPVETRTVDGVVVDATPPKAHEPERTTLPAPAAEKPVEQLKPKGVTPPTPPDTAKPSVSSTLWTKPRHTSGQGKQSEAQQRAEKKRRRREEAERIQNMDFFALAPSTSVVKEEVSPSAPPVAVAPDVKPLGWKERVKGFLGLRGAISGEMRAEIAALLSQAKAEEPRHKTKHTNAAKDAARRKFQNGLLMAVSQKMGTPIEDLSGPNKGIAISQLRQRLTELFGEEEARKILPEFMSR